MKSFRDSPLDEVLSDHGYYVHVDARRLCAYVLEAMPSRYCIKRDDISKAEFGSAISSPGPTGTHGFQAVFYVELERERRVANSVQPTIPH